VKVWDQYKHIKCSDFVAWWNKLSTRQKLDWQNEKDIIDSDLEKRIEQQLWERETRRKWD
tara:strand:+ start:304 stop:483 length:180 start_codon:yes stop_codon:yes gene_type:complete